MINYFMKKAAFFIAVCLILTPQTQAKTLSVAGHFFPPYFIQETKSGMELEIVANLYINKSIFTKNTL